MHALDLDNMVINCEHKEEQMKLLNSLRPTRDDRAVAAIINTLTFWRAYSDPEEYYHNQEIQSGRYQWIINQKILQLQQNCI